MSGVAASMNSLQTLAAVTKNQGPKALLTGESCSIAPSVDLKVVVFELPFLIS